MYDEAGLSEARGARRVTGRGSEGGPPGARLAERRCAALEGPAAAWAGERPKSTSFLFSRRFGAGQGESGAAKRPRPCPTRAPTPPCTVCGLPDQGADPSAHGAHPSRVGKGPFTTRERGFPTWDSGGCDLGAYPSQVGSLPFESGDRGVATAERTIPTPERTLHECG